MKFRGWVSAKHIQPQIYHPVIVWCVNLEHKMAWVNADLEWIVDSDIPASQAGIEITHWMELPDAPEGVGDE